MNSIITAEKLAKAFLTDQEGVYNTRNGDSFRVKVSDNKHVILYKTINMADWVIAVKNTSILEWHVLKIHKSLLKYNVGNSTGLEFANLLLKHSRLGEIKETGCDSYGFSCQQVANLNITGSLFLLYDKAGALLRAKIDFIHPTTVLQLVQ